jgi:hypothetical protein
VSATHAFAFSCDSTDGCHAHAIVAETSLPAARTTLSEVLDWNTHGIGDLCPDHSAGSAAPRMDPV